MEKFAICRICLSEEFELQYVLDTHLEEVYESLTSKPFAIRDGRPLRACYVCRARLQYCYQLRRACLRSEELFAQLLNSDNIEPLRRAQQASNTLRVTTVNNLCIGGVLPDSTGIKQEPIDIVVDGETDDEASGLVPKNSVATTIFENVSSLIPGNDIPHVIVKTESLKADPTIFEEPGPPRRENTVDITSCKQEIIEEQIYDVPVLNELTSNIDFVNSDDKNDVTSLLRVKKIQPKSRNRVNRSVRKSRSYKATAHGVSKNALHGGDTSAPVFEKPGTSRRRVNKITWCKQQMTITNNLTSQSGKNKPTSKIDSTNSDDKYNVTSSRGIAPRVYTRSAKTAKTYPCDRCREIFSTKSDLLKHVFLVHPYQPNDAPNTSVMDTSFLLTNGLTGVEPFPCNKCEKSFRCRQKLTIHLRIHNPDFCYQCDDCQKKFTSKASMKSHILRKHLGNRQCECRGCHKMYRRAAATNSNGSSSTIMRCCVTGQFL